MNKRCPLLSRLCSPVQALPLGKTFQAMVSVIAVKIQFSSPRGVLLSFSLPGILQWGKIPFPIKPACFATCTHAHLWGSIKAHQIVPDLNSSQRIHIADRLPLSKVYYIWICLGDELPDKGWKSRNHLQVTELKENVWEDITGMMWRSDMQWKCLFSSEVPPSFILSLTHFLLQHLMIKTTNHLLTTCNIPV